MNFLKLACILIFTVVFVSAAPAVPEPNDLPIGDVDEVAIIDGSIDDPIDGKKSFDSDILINL